MGHIFIPEENKRILLSYKGDLLDLSDQISLTKQASVCTRALVLLKTHWPLLFQA